MDDNVIWLNKDKRVAVNELNTSAMSLEEQYAVAKANMANRYAGIEWAMNHPGNAKIKGNCAEIDGDCA